VDDDMTAKRNKNVGMKQKKEKERISRKNQTCHANRESETEGRELDKRIKNRDKLGKYKQ